MDVLNVTEPWRRRPWIGFAIAIVGPALEVLVRLRLGGEFVGFPFLTFLPVVLLAWFLGSWRIAALSAGVSTLLGVIFLLKPPFVPQQDLAVQRISAFGFILIAALFVGVLDAMRTAWSRLQQANRDLQNRVDKTAAERDILASVVDATEALVHVLDREYRWLAVNAAAATMFERVHGKRPAIGDSLLELVGDAGPWKPPEMRSLWARALAGEPFAVPARFPGPDGRERHYEAHFEPLRNAGGGLIGAFQFTFDVTERVALETQAAQAQDALRQAQKAEALGRLTGGVAHDFNNMLQIILGNVLLARTRLQKGGGNVLTLLDGALEGAERAASLTHRLLAYARQKPLSPVSLDVNALVRTVSQLLRPTLGERIALECVLGGGVWRSRIDPGELESALVNLAMNARDAMPDGGKLTIETSNAALDEEYARAYDDVTPGQYVLLAVTDTGAGMSPEVMGRAFDPFYTTKPPGHGTGLGLSQVQGFVKQSRGHIKLYSEAGRGTTVKLYLPRDTTVQEPVGANADPTISGAEPALSEDVILVVDDEALVRQAVVEAVRSLGYTALEASGPSAALAIIEREPRIDMLLTDVVMPEMSGSELAERVRRQRPNLKVLYMTGYTPNAIVHNGMLDPGVSLLVKPFTIEQLRAKIPTLLAADR